MKGQCHCGTITFDVQFDPARDRIGKCNCSLCRRKNAVVGIIAATDFSLLTGQGEMGTYRWNTHEEAHNFCRNCGIYTHHTLSGLPARIGVNLACFDDVELGALQTVQVDGASLPVVAD